MLLRGGVKHTGAKGLPSQIRFFWVIGTISFLLESKISVFLRVWRRAGIDDSEMWWQA